MSYYVYLLTNSQNKVIYTGFTGDLNKRINQHKTSFYKNAFSSQYAVDKLVYFEEFQTATEAIKREKQIKAGSRQKKLDLINSMNPEWKDLNNEI